MIAARSPASGTRVIWQADDNTTGNRITVYTSGTTVMVDVVTGGVVQASLNLGVVAAGAAFKVALRYKANSFAASLNGAAVVTDISGTVPVVNRCRLGADIAGNHLCGTLSAFNGYAFAPSDSQLQAFAA